jgi:hypothetical protein
MTLTFKDVLSVGLNFCVNCDMRKYWMQVGLLVLKHDGVQRFLDEGIYQKYQRDNAKADLTDTRKRHACTAMYIVPVAKRAKIRVGLRNQDPPTFKSGPVQNY